MNRDNHLIQKLHAEYVARTRLDVRLSMERIYAWELWIAQKFTFEDLVMVLRHIHWMIRERRLTDASYGFRALIEKTARFEELRAQAVAERRKREHRYCPEKQGVLKATGRSGEPEPIVARTAHEVTQTDAFREFTKLKNTLIALLIAVVLSSCATSAQKQREKREMMNVIGF